MATALVNQVPYFQEKSLNLSSDMYSLFYEYHGESIRSPASAKSHKDTTEKDRITKNDRSMTEVKIYRKNDQPLYTDRVERLLDRRNQLRLDRIGSLSKKYDHVKSKVDSNLEIVNSKELKTYSMERKERWKRHQFSYGQGHREIVSAMPAVNRPNQPQPRSSLDSPARSKSASYIETKKYLNQGDDAKNDSNMANSYPSKYKPVSNDSNNSNNNKTNSSDRLENKYMDRSKYKTVHSRNEDDIVMEFLRRDPRVTGWSYNMNNLFNSRTQNDSKNNTSEIKSSPNIEKNTLLFYSNSYPSEIQLQDRERLVNNKLPKPKIENSYLPKKSLGDSNPLYDDNISKNKNSNDYSINETKINEDRYSKLRREKTFHVTSNVYDTSNDVSVNAKYRNKDVIRSEEYSQSETREKKVNNLSDISFKNHQKGDANESFDYSYTNYRSRKENGSANSQLDTQYKRIKRSKDKHNDKNISTEIYRKDDPSSTGYSSKYIPQSESKEFFNDSQGRSLNISSYESRGQSNLDSDKQPLRDSQWATESNNEIISRYALQYLDQSSIYQQKPPIKRSLTMEKQEETISRENKEVYQTNNYRELIGNIESRISSLMDSLSLDNLDGKRETNLVNGGSTEGRSRSAVNNRPDYKPYNGSDFNPYFPNKTFVDYKSNAQTQNNWDYLRNKPKQKKSVRVALENNRIHLYTPEYDHLKR